MRIFLASSNELAHERLYLSGRCVLYLNPLLRTVGVDEWVEMVKWEYLDSSMGGGHKQEEYNRELAACDMAVVLFWRKFGEYTESEFQTALQGVREGTSPRRRAVFFKETGETPSPDLVAYRSTLMSEDGIVTGRFSSDTELRERFLEALFAALRDGHPGFETPPSGLLRKYGLR